MVRSLWLVGLLACGGSSKPAPVAGRAPTKCAEVADHMLSWMHEAPTEDADRMRRVFMERCDQDGWSADAQQCFLGAGSMKEAAERCGDKLTPEQTNAFGAGIQGEAKPEPASGGAAPPPPPPRASSDPCEGGE